MHGAPKVTEWDTPELFRMLRQVTRAADQPLPRQVCLTADARVIVARRGPFRGHALGIGLRLFALLTVSELRGIVAYELGRVAARQCAFRADEVACRVAGSASVVTALLKLEDERDPHVGARLAHARALAFAGVLAVDRRPAAVLLEPPIRLLEPPVSNRPAALQRAS
jgi:hypothetical protein